MKFLATIARSCKIHSHDRPHQHRGRLKWIGATRILRCVSRASFRMTIRRLRRELLLPAARYRLVGCVRSSHETEEAEI